MKTAEHLRTLFTLIGAALLLAALAACAPLPFINALTPSGGYRKTADIAYGADARQRLDVYAPTATRGPGPAPVVLFFYGGNWNSGDRAHYQFVGEALASRGMVAVIADYRLYPQVRYPAFLEDGALALAWAARHAQQYGGDPQRLYLMGHSAGAYNAAMVALDPHWLAATGTPHSAVRGWIGLAGPYDFIPVQNQDTRPVFFYPDTPPESQPINHVAANSPPALLLAPARDALVDPLRNTGGLAGKLRAAGVKVEENYFPELGHSTLIAALWWPLRSRADVLDKIEAFVATDGGRLRPPHVAR